MILLVVILLFGSDQLPQLVKGLGKGIREINDAKNTIQNEIQKGTGGLGADLRKQASDIQNEVNNVQHTIKRQVGGIVDVVEEEAKDISKEINDKS